MTDWLRSPAVPAASFAGVVELTVGCRRALGAVGVEAECATGVAMTLEEAVTYAIALALPDHA